MEKETETKIQASKKEAELKIQALKVECFDLIRGVGKLQLEINEKTQHQNKLVQAIQELESKANA